MLFFKKKEAATKEQVGDDHDEKEKITTISKESFLAGGQMVEAMRDSRNNWLYHDTWSYDTPLRTYAKKLEGINEALPRESAAISDVIRILDDVEQLREYLISVSFQLKGADDFEVVEGTYCGQ